MEAFKINKSPFDLSLTTTEYFSEAVFENGKKRLTSILEKVQACKNRYNELIQKEKDTIEAHKKDKSVKVEKFDDVEYWRDEVWKDLEDEINKTFGFRLCTIESGPSDYPWLNCFVYSNDRFPIDGLITEKGYYDKTHSSVMNITITLPLIKKLEADEILAVLLHEFGHSIDPALVSIKYQGTSKLVDYITDRNNMKKNSGKKSSLTGVPILFICMGLGAILAMIKKFTGLLSTATTSAEKRIENIRDAVKRDKDKFDRQNATEAFADNFARMYGYGPELVKGLLKCEKEYANRKKDWGWFFKEQKRQEFIEKMTKACIKDVHKTDIHRIKALLKEYDKDIDDPKTPKKVKESLKHDKEELEKVLDKYLNDFDEFQNNVNKAIAEELDNLIKKS